MKSAAVSARELFEQRMQSIAIGAKVARRGRVWTVVDVTRYDTSARLQLRHGRRSVAVSVMVGHTGPSLWEAGLRSVGLAPVQRDLLEGGAA